MWIKYDIFDKSTSHNHTFDQTEISARSLPNEFNHWFPVYFGSLNLASFWAILHGHLCFVFLHPLLEFRILFKAKLVDGIEKLHLFNSCFLEQLILNFAFNAKSFKYHFPFHFFCSFLLISHSLCSFSLKGMRIGQGIRHSTHCSSHSFKCHPNQLRRFRQCDAYVGLICLDGLFLFKSSSSVTSNLDFVADLSLLIFIP